MNEKSEQERLFLLARDALQDTLRHQERRAALLWRLFLSDMKYYALFALISILALSSLASIAQGALPIFWFALLSLFGLYTIYQQKYYGMDELTKTCWINSGRCFLYKAAVCALTQLSLFAVLLIQESGNGEAGYLWLIMNTLLPALTAQLAALIADRFIHHAVQVISVYALIYTGILFLLYSIPMISAMLTLQTLIVICLGLGIIDMVLTLLHSRSTQKGTFSWN